VHFHDTVVDLLPGHLHSKRWSFTRKAVPRGI
jgi:hypothetical protein